MLYYDDKEKARAFTQRINETFRLIQGFLCSLLVVICRALKDRLADSSHDFVPRLMSMEESLTDYT